MRPARRDLLIVVGVGLVAAAAGAIVGPMLLQSRSGAAALLSARLPDLQGRLHSLDSWTGRVTVINFWATWCAPCREEMPMLGEVRQEYAPKGAEIVGIAVDNAKNVREFAAKLGIEYPLLIGDASTIPLMKALGNPAGGLPFTIVLDRRGTLARRHLGPLRREDLTGVIADLLR